ncbi:MAG: hypothetical protein DCC75_06590 [Proteobacteria bacterium]|nr:MAG: hypothetical protein DCC75_06590 [Pseudomonadota bacterium]
MDRNFYFVGIAFFGMINGLFNQLWLVFALIHVQILSPALLFGSVPLTLMFASLMVSTATVILGGIPAALYERYIGAKDDSTEASLWIWLAGTALLRPKREGLVRNSAVVAANTGSIESLEALRGCALEDSSSVVRQHALWALYKLSCQGGARERASFMAVFDRFRDSEESRDAALAEEVRALKNLI